VVTSCPKGISWAGRAVRPPSSSGGCRVGALTCNGRAHLLGNVNLGGALLCIPENGAKWHRCYKLFQQLSLCIHPLTDYPACLLHQHAQANLPLTFLAQLHLLAGDWVVIVAATWDRGLACACQGMPGSMKSACLGNNVPLRLGWTSWLSVQAATTHFPAAVSTAQHSTAQHSTAQHSTAQHSTAQHSAGHLSKGLPMDPLTSSSTITLRLGRWNDAAWMPVAQRQGRGAAG